MRAGAVDRDHLVRTIRIQADACERLGSPMYAVLLGHVADDAEAGGVVVDLLAGREHDLADSLLALRMMGAVHRLVLEGHLPQLAVYYPTVGGSADPEAAWPVLRGVLRDHAGEIRALLDSAPQTNEVGRAAVLVGGLLHVAAAHRLPVRLIEIGASAGLNLRADEFRIDFASGGRGPLDSPVVLPDAWHGVLPPVDAPLRVVDRLGSDLAPVDPTTPDGRLRLTAYVWPDQPERLGRLRGALAIAARVPATLVAESALQTVRSLALTSGVATVLWHSVMWQYLAQVERDAVARRLADLGAAATADAPLVHLALEPRRRTPEHEPEFLVTMRSWPGGAERIIGAAHPHGVPVEWE